MSILSTTPDFSRILAAQRRREEEEIRRLHTEVAATSIPLPDELLAKVVTKFGDTAQSILRGHAGYRLFRVRESYFASVRVFDIAVGDLLAEIAAFEEEAIREGTKLFDLEQRERLKAIERQIQKELFAAANAALSLVDHARRLQKAVELDGYDAMRLKTFNEDGLHDLVTGLRVLLHHLEVLEAGWQRTRATNRLSTATFTLEKMRLMRTLDEFSDKFSGGQLGRMRRYLEGLPDHIDLAILFSDYRERCRRFNDWLKDQLAAAPPPELADYDRCQLEKTRYSVRTQWNAVLGNWLQNVPNPHVHRHLPKYINEEQLAQVYALPLNSPEQADKVLDLMDDYGAADDAMRRTVRTLFSRASDDGAPQPGAKLPDVDH
ncbi:hypothetical protein [Sinorhizobium meliloti]|uniref:hypothetical protein n=1 Tax=Rhizobium meliloti TaxID=382 RepID=UPI000FD8106F|nr:hypothetical protein [Sinorhizobium meliloti]RVN46030.1 hypothetical protein CN108_34535 [Sinorhizobium meliloti]